MKLGSVKNEEELGRETIVTSLGCEEAKRDSWSLRLVSRKETERPKPYVCSITAYILSAMAMTLYPR